MYSLYHSLTYTVMYIVAYTLTYTFQYSLVHTPEVQWGYCGMEVYRTFDYLSDYLGLVKVS